MMKKSFRSLACCFMFIIFAGVGFAQTNNPEPQPILQPTPQASAAPQQTSIIPGPPNINATAYVLMDANSGQIIAQKNMDQKHPPASLTKMMTMYIASQALQAGTIKIDDPVTISKKSWQMGGSKMFIKVGTQVPVKDLVQGIIVDSGNDACVAMSEYIAGSEDAFVNMMNAETQRLGMNNTHYQDCTGLPHPDHYSTAHDLAILASHIVKDYPQDYQWYKQKWFKYNGIRQPNRNRLLWRFPMADGLKTGHTSEAGFCLVSSAVNGEGMRLIAVVLGAPTDEARATDSITLLTYGFRFYQSQMVYQAGSTVTTPRVWYGAEKTVPAGVMSDLYVTYPRLQGQKLTTTIQPQPNLKAPIKKGQQIGTITVNVNGQTVSTQPLVALQDVAKGGMWRTSVDSVGHLFHGWFSSKKAAPKTQPNNNSTTTTPQQSS